MIEVEILGIMSYFLCFFFRKFSLAWLEGDIMCILGGLRGIFVRKLHVILLVFIDLMVVKFFLVVVLGSHPWVLSDPVVTHKFEPTSFWVNIVNLMIELLLVCFYWVFLVFSFLSYGLILSARVFKGQIYWVLIGIFYWDTVDLLNGLFPLS